MDKKTLNELIAKNNDEMQKIKSNLQVFKQQEEVARINAERSTGAIGILEQQQREYQQQLKDLQTPPQNAKSPEEKVQEGESADSFGKEANQQADGGK